MMYLVESFVEIFRVHNFVEEEESRVETLMSNKQISHHNWKA